MSTTEGTTMTKRLVSHRAVGRGGECYGTGYSVENLASVFVGNATDYSTNPSTTRVNPDGQRWLCPECELAIKGEDVEG